MFMEFMYNDTDKQIVRLLYEYQVQEEVASSSRPRRPRRNIERNREERHDRLFNDYFLEASVYTNEQFRRRYQMHKHGFLRIVEALGQHDEYFRVTIDATGRTNLSPQQKCTVVIRMLAYEISVDSVDDYLRICETTTLECVDKFTRGVINIFRAQYLRRSTNEAVERLLRMGFPGGKPTFMLEVVALQDLWIWHAFFGVADSNNDINVLNQSNVFNDVLHGRAPAVHYKVNRTEYNMSYYLSDGIYPELATFVKSIPMPQGDRKNCLPDTKKAQERILNEHLEFSSPDLRSYVTRLDLGTWMHLSV